MNRARHVLTELAATVQRATNTARHAGLTTVRITVTIPEARLLQQVLADRLTTDTRDAIHGRRDQKG